MRIIHCADLHLESDMTSYLSKERADKRRDELLDTFDRMVSYASENKIDAILIAGDLYDTASRIRVGAKKRVSSAILNNPSIKFFYLKGNHDMADISDCFEDTIPDNLFLFSEEQWISYDLGDIVISGMELNRDNNSIFAAKLDLEDERTNIVMLHGQEANYQGRKISYDINFNELKRKGIDYLAMGHIHSYREFDLDDRCRVVYPGCLEGRGFDEAGSKGFVLIEVNDGRIEYEFVPFASRTIHIVEVDVAPEDDMFSLIAKVKSSVASIKSCDIVRLLLKGYKQMDFILSTDQIEREALDGFFYEDIKDNTRSEINYDIFTNDKSLKGEFVRLLKDSDLSQDAKSEIAVMGIKALRGEEL